jgi:hypothetical protein
MGQLVDVEHVRHVVVVVMVGERHARALGLWLQATAQPCLRGCHLAERHARHKNKCKLRNKRKPVSSLYGFDKAEIK